MREGRGSMIALTGRDLTIDDVVAVARDGARVELAAPAQAAVAEAWDYLQRLMAEGHPIYGLTTGFGALDGRAVAPADNAEQQRNLLRSHAAGVGPAMPADAVRAMLVARANVLSGGRTGARPQVVEALIAMLNRGVVPQVPEAGSVGACGDLAPLAHLCLPLIGEGRAWFDGESLPGGEAMRRAGVAVPDTAGRDGLALINGTEQTTGIGALVVADAARLVASAEAAAAMSLEALGALDDSFDAHVAAMKPHPGLVATAARLRGLTAGSESVGPPRPDKLRDALSLRCIPQVIGATREAIDAARSVLAVELNAANDNPLFDVADGWITSNSGNFHGQRAGEALDALAMSLASLAVISERRAARLVDHHHNGGLPAFLIHPQASPGLNSGMMIAQYTAASLVAELRTRAVPASIQSVPTCANTEDHVPMAPIAARHARWVVDTAERVVAIEFLLAGQALDLRGARPGAGVAACHAALRDVVPLMRSDRVLADDIANIVSLIQAESLTGMSPH
jgi:histidine ammonia-lyase